MTPREERLLDLLTRARDALDKFCGEEAATQDGGCDCETCRVGLRLIEDLDAELMEDE